MEENKDVSVEDGLSASSGHSAECGLSIAGGLNTACEPSAERRLRASGGVHTVGRQRIERRWHVPDGLRAQDGAWMAGAYAPRCDQCKQPILRLETYITVGDVTLCDGCYMNMGTKEFLSKIGGELRVME